MKQSYFHSCVRNSEILVNFEKVKRLNFVQRWVLILIIKKDGKYNLI